MPYKIPYGAVFFVILVGLQQDSDSMGMMLLVFAAICSLESVSSEDHRVACVLPIPPRRYALACLLPPAVTLSTVQVLAILFFKGLPSMGMADLNYMLLSWNCFLLGPILVTRMFPFRFPLRLMALALGVSLAEVGFNNPHLYTQVNHFSLYMAFSLVLLLWIYTRVQRHFLTSFKPDLIRRRAKVRIGSVRSKERRSPVWVLVRTDLRRHSVGITIGLVVLALLQALYMALAGQPLQTEKLTNYMVWLYFLSFFGSLTIYRAYSLFYAESQFRLLRTLPVTHGHLTRAWMIVFHGLFLALFLVFYVVQFLQLGPSSPWAILLILQLTACQCLYLGYLKEGYQDTGFPFILVYFLSVLTLVMIPAFIYSKFGWNLLDVLDWLWAKAPLWVYCLLLLPPHLWRVWRYTDV